MSSTKKTTKITPGVLSDIAKILGVRVSSSWEISDYNEGAGLYLVHFTAEGEAEVPQLRGVVVDFYNKIVVSKMFGKRSEFVAQRIDFLERPGGSKIRVSAPDQTLELASDRCVIVQGHDGTRVTTFRHSGRTWYHTHRKLGLDSTRWGPSKTVAEMWKEAGGPAEEDIYNPLSIFSPTIHHFILAHRDVLDVHKVPKIGDGYVIWSGSETMYDAEENPFWDSKVDWAKLHHPDFILIEDELCAPVQDPVEGKRFDATASHGLLFEKAEHTCVPNMELSIEEANIYLQYGHYYDLLKGVEFSDPRLCPGEFVIIFEYDEAGHMVQTHRVSSPAYVWRKSLRTTPNLRLQFFKLTEYQNIGKTDGGKRDKAQDLGVYFDFLGRHFPFLHPEEITRLLDDPNSLPICLSHPSRPASEVRSFMKERPNRLRNILACYILALPNHHAKAAREFLTDFYQTVHDVTEWIFDVALARSVPELQSETGLLRILTTEYNRERPGLTGLIAANYAKKLHRCYTRVANLIYVSFNCMQKHWPITRPHEFKTKKYRQDWADKFEDWKMHLQNLVSKEHGPSLYNISVTISQGDVVKKAPDVIASKPKSFAAVASDKVPPARRHPNIKKATGRGTTSWKKVPRGK